MIHSHHTHQIVSSQVHTLVFYLVLGWTQKIPKSERTELDKNLNIELIGEKFHWTLAASEPQTSNIVRTNTNFMYLFYVFSVMRLFLCWRAHNEPLIKHLLVRFYYLFMAFGIRMLECILWYRSTQQFFLLQYVHDMYSVNNLLTI